MTLPNLRHIFSSFRSPLEERDFSRAAFYKGVLFIISCMSISLLATSKSRWISGGGTKK